MISIWVTNKKMTERPEKRCPEFTFSSQGNTLRDDDLTLNGIPRKAQGLQDDITCGFLNDIHVL